MCETLFFNTGKLSCHALYPKTTFFEFLGDLVLILKFNLFFIYSLVTFSTGTKSEKYNFVTFSTGTKSQRNSRKKNQKKIFWGTNPGPNIPYLLGLKKF
jgi:hypothetical protein